MTSDQNWKGLDGGKVLKELLEDDTISEIMVNAPNKIYAEREGKIFLTKEQFKDEASLVEMIKEMCRAVGKEVDSHTPLVAAWGNNV